jgi:hypothetical protein
MKEEMRERIVNDARQTLDNASNTPNFADVFWSYRLFLLQRPEFEEFAAYARRCLLDSLVSYSGNPGRLRTHGRLALRARCPEIVHTFTGVCETSRSSTS